MSLLVANSYFLDFVLSQSITKRHQDVPTRNIRELAMYSHGKRTSLGRYRFTIPAEVDVQDILFMTSPPGCFIAPSDCKPIVVPDGVEISLIPQISGGFTSVYAFFVLSYRTSVRLSNSMCT